MTTTCRTERRYTMNKKNYDPELISAIKEAFPDFDESWIIDVDSLPKGFFRQKEEEIPEGIEPDDDREHYTCTCCGRRFYGMGNDPLPLTRETWGVEDGPRACGECDEQYVIPTRHILSSMGFEWRSIDLKPYQRKRIKKIALHGMDFSELRL